MTQTEPLDRLRDVLSRYEQLAIAVSGVVDSMTLAHVAHGVTTTRVFHAVSPAVPDEATQRVADHAQRYGWQLQVIRSDEFSDPQYLSNPVNRCFFCKSNLYSRIAAATDWTIASGANIDDLGDYRPGLIAARERDVVHPFVKAGIDKSQLRKIAADFGLADIADLPAQPCLASRVETGIAIDAGDLALIHEVETEIRAAAPSRTEVRCRILKAGMMLELGDVPPEIAMELGKIARRISDRSGRSYAGVRPYVRGAAFIHGET